MSNIKNSFTVEEIRKYILHSRPDIKDIDHENVIRFVEGKNYEYVNHSNFIIPPIGSLIKIKRSIPCLEKPNKVYTLPIYWSQTKKKTVLVGMNAYRNWHYLVSAKFKREFTQLVEAQINNESKINKPYQLHIKLFYKNPNCDGSNIIALIEKVFLDALISAGLLQQDTVIYHKGSTWEVIEQDKVNPRCEIVIKEI